MNIFDIYLFRVSTLQSQLSEEKAISTAAGRARDELANRSENEQKVIEDLKEQVRDLAFFVEASTNIEKQGNFEELRGGQVLMPTSPNTSKTKGKKNKKGR